MIRITNKESGKGRGIIPSLLTVFCLSFVVVSCGQKGALYIPQASINEGVENEGRHDDETLVEVPEL